MMQNNEARSTVRPRLLRWLLLVVLLAFAAIAVKQIRANRLPTMSRADFDAAKVRWEDAALSDYEITVEVRGMQPGKYDVVVENGIATKARFDGRDLKRQRTFGTWAVTGMFATLSRDLETDDKHGYLLLKAEFDEEYGFPSKYERMEMRTGAHDTLQWEVTRFVKR